jgi:hypothetical protein
MFGEHAKTRMTSNEVRSGRPPIDFLDIRILAVPDEQPFIRLIRLLKVWVFPAQLS